MVYSRAKSTVYFIVSLFLSIFFYDLANAQLPGYEYRKKFSIDNTKVSEISASDLSNFPVLIDLTDSDLSAGSGLVKSPNGFDIAFTAADGTTQLDHELETYISGTGQIQAWVRFPTLNATTDTDFYIYFGNLSQTTDQSTPSTWDANYQLVMHLEDMADATANGNNGTDNGTASVSGKIGNARDFNSANNDYISIADDPTLDITSDLTISVWIRIDNFGDVPDLITKGDYNESYATWIRSQETLRFADDNVNIAESSSTLTSGATHYVTFTNTGSGSAIYIDGILDVTGTAGNFSTNNNPLTISSSAWSLNGWVDEVRISNSARSADWINTEYLNQDDPVNFLTESDEPPILANIESSPISSVAGGAPIYITSEITLSTPFADSIDGATIQITGNYDSSEDELDFSNTMLISGSWSSGTGILTLSGRASVADYQAALRAVTYQNTDGSSPDLSTRTISFTVNDLFYSSNTMTRDMLVTQVYSDLSTDISNVVFHYDAQDIDGDLDTGDQPLDGTNVANWGDRSDNALGSGTDLSASATPAGDQPVFDSYYMGERGGLLFDGMNDAMTPPNNTILNTSDFYEKSFAALFRTGNSVAGLQIIYEQGGATRGYQISVKDGSAYAFVWNSNEWSGGNQYKSINLGTVIPNESYIIIASQESTTGNTWSASMNGGSIIQQTNVDYQRSHSGSAKIGEEDGTRDPATTGNNPTGLNSFSGYIGELISWNSALSNGQITSVYNFLCDKWCNEAPVVSSVEGSNLDFTEGDSPVSITNSLVISDADNTVLDSAKVIISGNYTPSEDELAFSDGVITGSWDSGSGTMTLTGNANLAQYQTALRSVTYENTNTVNPSTALRQIDFKVFDWDDSSNIDSRTVNIIALNSSPTLSGVSGGPESYSEGDGAVSMSFTAAISDVDDTNMEAATIQIVSNYYSGEDYLDFTDTGNITGSFSVLSGTLTLSGSATVAEYQTALENVTYENTSSDPVEVTRTISFKVNDGDNDSNTESRSLNVSAINSSPVLSNLEGTDLTYPQEAINISNTISVYDPDDTMIDSALVLITGNFKAVEDSLLYSTLYGIEGIYDETTGKLKLFNTASFGDYETALRSVEYYNYATIPTGPERTISFLAYDDDEAESDTVKRVIEVSAVESISNLLVWLRADAGFDTTGAGEVTTWYDQSGNNNDFSGVANTGTEPTYSLSNTAFGGKPAINFAGNGDHFEDANGENYINGLSEFTLFLVYKSDLTNTDRGLWHAVIPDNDDKTFTIRYDADGANTGGAFSNVVKTGILANDPDNQLESFSDIQTTGAQITSLHWESGSVYDLYVDGILNNPSSAAAPPTGTISSATTAIVGKGGKDHPFENNNRSWDGLIAEVILYGRNLSEVERESVEDYLSVKYSSAIRKITAATGGSAISADNANGAFTTLTGPIIQEGFPGELTNSGTIVLTAPSGYRWNTGSSPVATIDAAYGGSTNLNASFTSFSGDSSTAKFSISSESTSNPGQITFSGLQVRPNTGVLPNTGNILNTGTTGQGGATNYGTLTMVPGVIDSLTFVQQPSITNVNSSITPSVRVQLVDQFGNSVETPAVNIDIAKQSGPGSLSGTTTIATNVLGIAVFDDLTFDNIGVHELVTSSEAYKTEISNSFNIVNAGTLTGFKIERVPSGNISTKSAGQSFDIKITAIDGTQTTVTTFNGTVVITSSCSMGSGQGTTTNFASGILNSHTVSITVIGNCTITATNSAGSETGISNSFNVTPGAASAATSIITASPTVILNDGASTSTITVQLKDAYGNNLSSGGSAILLSETEGSLGSVTDNANGTYTSILTSSTSITTSTITGTLNAVAITDNANVEFAAFSHIWESQLGSPAVASDWFDTQNWNVGSVPGASSVVLIPANPTEGNEFPVVDVTNTTISALSIESGAELTVSGSVNFVVTGDVTGNGDILGSNNDSLTVGGDIDVPDITLGTVIFNGSSEQSITSPHTFVNLELNNPTSLFPTDNLTVTGTLTLTDGELFIPSGKNLISQAQLYGSGVIRFQRIITTVKGWRMISSPVSTTFGDLFDGTLTQGFTGATYDPASLPMDSVLQPNVFTYIESYPGTDNQRFRVPANTSQSIVQGQGMWVYVFGDIATDSRYNDPLPDTLDVSGQEWDGNGTEVNFGVTYNTSADSGWNFVGNPFGAAINWNSPSNWTKTNISSTIYIWDPAANSGNGEYLTWNGTTGTLGSGIIPPFQGFWVKANGPSPVLKVKKTAKTTGGNFLRKENHASTPVLELVAQTNGLSKRTSIMFSDTGTRGVDEMDAYRLVPFSDSRIDFFSTLENGEQLAINNQPKSFNYRIKIPLVLDAFIEGNGTEGEYTISISGMKGIPDDWIITLIDNSNGKEIDLRQEQDYTLYHNTIGKAETNYNPYSPQYRQKSRYKHVKNRLTLLISTEEIEANIPKEVYLHQNYPNPFNPTTSIPFGLDEDSDVSLIVYDMLGRKVQTLVSGFRSAGNHEIQFNTGRLASGVYVYRLTTSKGTFLKKMTLIK